MKVSKKKATENDLLLSLHDKTYRRLVGGAELLSSQSLPSSISFQDLKNKPLGDISR